MWVCFVELQEKTEQVKQRDRLDFVLSFNFCCVEDDLDRDGCYEEDVVSMERAKWDVLGKKK